MKTILKIMVGVIAAFILMAVAAVALIGSAADEVQKDSDKHAITKQEFRQAKKGMTIQAVIKSLGTPDDKQVTQVDGLKKQTCIYYNQVGDLTSMYQFCFDGKKLSSKSLY